MTAEQENEAANEALTRRQIRREVAEEIRQRIEMRAHVLSGMRPPYVTAGLINGSRIKGLREAVELVEEVGDLV